MSASLFSRLRAAPVRQRPVTARLAGLSAGRGRLSMTLLLVLPLAASSARAESAQPAAGSSAGATTALPRQFSVEVGTSGTVFADGMRLGASSELERWAQRAISQARFAGAVVFGDEERDGRAVGEAIEALRRAGFADVRRAGRPAPPEVSALLTSGPPPVVSAGKAAPPTPTPEQTSTGPTLATVGLHVGGMLNREPHRSRLVSVFERQFNAFRTCHQRADRHLQGASFGVDLLIPKTGGRAKVRQTRTRLDGKGFRACMHGVFEAIRFAPPPSERAEIVSYSVLFKPNTP